MDRRHDALAREIVPRVDDVRANVSKRQGAFTHRLELDIRYGAQRVETTVTVERSELHDADDVPAINSQTGFVTECARSFWTPTATSTGDGYWVDLEDSNCAGFPAASNSPDGNLVEKGGQGYMLRKITETARVVKTCDAASASGLVAAYRPHEHEPEGAGVPGWA